MQTLTFRLFGFEFHAHPGFWLFLGVILLFSLEGGAISGAFIMPAVVALAFITHELGHAAVARAFRLRVFPIELSFMVGTTPHQRTTPGRQFFISIAGPFAGFLLALVAILAIFGLDVAEIQQPHLSTFLEMLVFVNLSLSCFNLLPVIPFDGGNALRAAVGTFFGERTGLKIAAMVSVVLGTALVLIGWQYGMLFLAMIAGFSVWQNIQTLREMRAF